MSKAKDEYYKDQNYSKWEYAEVYIKQLEQEKAELIEKVCNKCQIQYLCERDNLVCENMDKYKTKNT